MLASIARSSVVFFMVFAFVGGSAVPREEEYLRIRKSEEIRSYMNETADPCDNFYNFACGNWPAIHSSTDTQFQTNIFQLAKLELGRKVAQMLSTRNADDTEVDRKAKDYYEACLSVPGLDVYRVKLKEIVKEFGQMPVLEGDKWQANDFDWLKTIAEINHRYGNNIIIGFVIRPDPDDSSVNRLVVRHPNFKDVDEYLDETRRNKYKKKIVENLKKYLNLNDDLAQKTAKEIIDFEASLVKGSKADPGASIEYAYTTTVKELSKKYSSAHLDFKKLFEIAFGSIPKGDIFEIYPEYQENLIKVMQSTSKKVVANYIFYKLVLSFSPPTFEVDTERQEKCVEVTKTFFANVLDNMMYRMYDTTQAEEAVLNMFHDMQSFFDSALASETYYSWISKKTRKRAVEKLRAMTIKINSYEDVNFAEEYGRLTVDKDDYVGNRKSIKAQRAIQTRAKLSEPVKPHYDGAKSSFTPQYIVTENTIRMPLAALQPSFFWSSANPNAVNLGQLGFLIGHEMVHAFDDLGRKYNKQGNIIDWWDKQSARNFAERTQCFINQSQTFTYAGKPLPKAQHQTENIADNGGLRLAYESYMTWYDGALRPRLLLDKEMLPDLDYKTKQLFFLSFAQVWCTDTHSDYVDYIVLNDPHPPANLRTNGPLLNYEEFATAFNCPTGSPMNPDSKCKIY